MQFPIGYDDFGDVIDNKLAFIDKSLLVKEFLDDRASKVSVVLRPRRFGKTLNLSLLRHFFAAEVYGRKTAGLFDNLKIAQLGDEYMQHQGKYPVVSVTFKDIKELNYTSARQALAKILSLLYRENQVLLDSEKLTTADKHSFSKILNGEGTDVDLQSSLQDLMRYLFQHYGVKPYLLIDEYDTPIISAYISDYYAEMISLMRGMFGMTLKSNPYLDRAMITGILRVAKESMFSGLNNLKVFSALNANYSEHFGFTESEVENILVQAGLSEKSAEIRAWYNGYQIGGRVIYNPWSIANCLYEKGDLRPYWINTSDNQLVKDLLKQSPLEFKTNFEILLADNYIEEIIDESLVFNALRENPDSLWSLLLMSGYLTAVSSETDELGRQQCRLAIPNREVRSLYGQIIEEWLSDDHGIRWYNEFMNSLLIGNIDIFKRGLEKVMLQIASYHDMAKEPEAFYHGLLLGFSVSLYKQYDVKSNRESGLGRFDIMLLPNDKTQLAIVFEFKIREKNETLEQTATRALAQIEAKQYAAECAQRGIARVLKIGIGFENKEFVLLSAVAEA